MERIHFLFNAEFDFALRSEGVKPQILQAAESMEPLFAPVFTSRDRIISSCRMSSDFNSYLDSLGIDNARLSAPCRTADSRGVAWGWSEKVIHQLSGWNYTLVHPSPECCREVNSREFCAYISEKHSIGTPFSQLVNRCEQLQDFLDTTPGEEFVAKPLFGNAGAGFYFFSRDSSDKAAALIENEPVILEPWLNRTADIASLFEVKQDGVIEIIGHHRNLCNRSGAFYGTMIIADDPVIMNYRNQIDRMIEHVGTELHQRGYFGIVSIDSFCYRENNEEKIALCIDINCRFTMSYIAHKTYKKVGLPVLFYRFLARKRHRLPVSIDDFTKQLGSLAYTKEKKSGVIAMSPMRIEGSDHVVRQPLRSAFAVVGESEEEVIATDNQLLELMKATKK